MRKTFVILGFWFVFVGIIAYRDFRQGAYFNIWSLRASSGRQSVGAVHVSCRTESQPRKLLFIFQSDHISELTEKIKTSLRYPEDEYDSSVLKKDQVGIKLTFSADAPRDFQLTVVNEINKILGTNCVLE